MEMLDFENEPDYAEASSSLVARSVKDPIHDLIPLSLRLSRFIDTKQFQRLRSIKQLGTSYYVWIGASHNRFEHCIGVAFLARSMASHLQKRQPELGITDRDIECIEIAGLCHDLGHGPWSHVWDGLFIPQALPGQKWKHEDGSSMMFDALVKENGIPLTTQDENFIKALIAGDPSQCSPDEKKFLFDIVANRRNGLDVDKFDYILRDSHMVGDKMSIALPRIIKSARVLDNQICYDIKDANQIYEICAMRFKLHKIVYNHKAAKAIEYMIIDGLLAAEPHLHIADRVFDPEKYLHLTDDIMPQIEASTEPELADARAIFARIRHRDLYRMVDYKVVDWPYRAHFEECITPARIVEAARALPISDGSSVADVSKLRPEDIICDFSIMHYGMGSCNPLDFVKFYSKRNPNVSSTAGRGDYSNLMPEFHAELLVRIFTKKAEFFGIVQAGYRACLAAMPALISSKPLPLSEEESGPPASTPPAPDVPSTPRTRRTFSRVSSFSNNAFTTVSANFVPRSPTRGSRKPKREREAEPGESSGVGSGGGKKPRGG
ncbi:Deoxynucleoside triphosphate triphosphohydrolase SAMHD1 [Hypsizygus marmoreus]|uniref:Deoxynucleoside triphosphate triphosphohydrolase SAMHD1 n=1 Tax=Hypsizygus marmoreus TaxID=39966 RepID=A0A369JDX6_HYPMA|nr:Deoxynucleoside triphosphate triphosphohydrolase SAMHD1 [Hypsizygus marmoreus]